MPSYFDSQGKSISISLVKELAKGGEGTVWQTNQSGYLAKVYQKPSQEQITKLQLMIANPPQNPTAGQNHFAISWPTHLIKDNQGNWVGFLMPEIKNAKELVYVYHPKNRNIHAPAFNWYCLHIIAYNLVSIIREIHTKNYVIGDISVKNILVNERSLVALIDTDSFQVTDSATKKVYRCSVGSEGLTPPELIGKTLSQLTQTRYHDRFRLAVIIHYLLFGYHPFMGIWTGSGNPPGQNDAISQGHWPYGTNSLLKPSRNTIPLTILHPELKKCFLKCFNDGHQSPTDRPSPEDWFNALQEAINDLVVCGKNKNHIYSQHSGRCCWCDRAQALSVDIFPSVKNQIAPQRIPVTSSNQAMLQQLQSQNKALTQQLSQINTQLSNLQLDKQSLTKEKDEIKEQLSNLQLDKQSLTKEKDEIKEQLSNLQSQNQSSNQQLSKVNIELSKQGQRLNFIKNFAIASTIIATTLAGLSVFQYYERNQIIQQIEQLRKDNNLSSGQWNLSSSYSFESELENFGNIIEGEKPLIYFDLDELVKELHTKTTSLDNNINKLKGDMNNLENTKKDLEDKNNSLQSRINELVNQNNSRQSQINELVNQNNSRQSQINELVNQNQSLQKLIKELENPVPEG